MVFLSARTVSAALDPGEPFIVTVLSVHEVGFTDVAVPLAVLCCCLLDVYVLCLTKPTGVDSEGAADVSES